MNPLKLEVLPSFQGLIIKDFHIISTSLNYLEFDVQDAHKMMQYKYQIKDYSFSTWKFHNQNHVYGANIKTELKMGLQHMAK